jgi:hypothetical protein
VLKEFVYRLRGELDISENQDRIDFVAGGVEQCFIILLYDKPVTCFPDDGPLLRDIDICHQVPLARPTLSYMRLQP